MADKGQERKGRQQEINRTVDQEASLFQGCFKGTDGEKAMAILEELFYDRPSYTKGDQYHTAFREGQRDVVGYIKEALGRGNENA